MRCKIKVTETFLEFSNGGDPGKSLDQVHLHKRVMIDVEIDPRGGLEFKLLVRENEVSLEGE